ncbi:sugar ABC transporter permease [Pseudarthrobacter sp. J64]|nr:sugar ABC transporter permease [Pseudarthrobacter sp. J64]MEE2570828.1 sugar ABC transporter permease [Pseudarthrobacter sp. J64]
MTLPPPGTTPRGGLKAVARGRRRKLTFDKISFMAVFLGIPLVIYLIFVIWPFVQAFVYSLTDWSGFSPNFNFVGLDNYARIFSDDLFLRALGNNIILLIVVPIVTVFLSLVLATMVTVGGSSKGTIKGLKNSSFYRVVSFFPYTIPAIAIGIMWGQIYDPSGGLLNGLLNAMGFNVQNFPWLGNASTAMGASIFVIIWGFVGFYMVLFIAGIKGIPSELFEAARIDGAGRFRTAVSLTIPMIRDNIQTAYVYLGIFALDAFVYMAALFPNAGGPDNTTLVMSQQLFFTAFQRGQFGMATAMGVVLALTTLIFAGLVFLVNKLTGGTDGARL